MINVNSCKILFSCGEGDETFHTILSLGADKQEHGLLQKRSVVSVLVSNIEDSPSSLHTHKHCVQYPTRLSVVLLGAQRYILFA